MGPFRLWPADRSAQRDRPRRPIVTLATAHPAKFPDAVERASGVRPGLPRRVAHLFDRAERYDRLPADAQALKAYIRDRA
jgi:threonine synthase